MMANSGTQFFIEDITNIDIIGDQYVNENSLKSSPTFSHSQASTLEASPTILLSEGSQYSVSSVQAHHIHQSSLETTCSPEHKRSEKTPMVVGTLVPEILFWSPRSEIGPIILEDHGSPVQSGGTEIVSNDVENLEYHSGPDLRAMPSLKRNSARSSSFDTSKDFHSPIQSDNSTETIDSEKLRQPKKPLHELYPLESVHDTSAFELPRVARSKLPTTSSTRIRKDSFEGENKMSNSKDMPNSSIIEENASLVSAFPSVRENQ